MPIVVSLLAKPEAAPMPLRRPSSRLGDPPWSLFWMTMADGRASGPV